MTSGRTSSAGRIGDQIAEAFEAHGLHAPAERRARALDLASEVGLPEPERILRRLSAPISGGQRQRIMIARPLVLEPALLIADEPTTALDVTTQAQILKLIKELRERRNTGVLFITHDFGVVAEVAHRVVVMQHGRVVEQGRPRTCCAGRATTNPHADPRGAEPVAAGARADHRGADRAAGRRPDQDLASRRLLRRSAARSRPPRT